MKQRSRVGGEPAKKPRRKTVKRGNAPKSVGRHGAGSLLKKIALLEEERDEALANQTSTADVLKVISRSTFDLQTVLDTLVQTAARLCKADAGGVTVRQGDIFRYTAFYGFSKELIAILRERPLVPSRDTVAGRTAMEGQVVHIADLTTDPSYGWAQAAAIKEVRSIIGVPLLRDGMVVGTFSLTRNHVEPFTKRQIEVIRTFADQAVIAIENARLFEAEQQRARELMESLEQQTATAKVLQVISRSTFALQTVLSTLVEFAARLCHADQAALFLRDGDVYRLATIYGYAGDMAEFADIPPLRPDRTSMTGRVALEGKAVHVHDVLADPEYGASGYQRAFGYRTNLSVPLLRDGETIGVFGLVRTEVNPFSDKQIELVTTFADQAVIAIENARLLTELRELLEQQTATAEVLSVINASPGDLAPVFDAMVDKALRLCDATYGALAIFEGNHYRAFSLRGGMPEELTEFVTKPVIVPPGTPPDRLRHGEDVVHVRDLADTPPERQTPGLRAMINAGARTSLWVSLRKETTALGFFAIYRTEARPFSQREIDLVRNFSSQAVIAIENTRLLTELRQALAQQTATSEILASISRSLIDPKPVFDSIVHNLLQLFGTRCVTVQLLKNEIIEMPAANGQPGFEGIMSRYPRPLDDTTIGGQAMLAKKVVQYSPVVDNPIVPLAAQELARDFDYDFIIAAPMMRQQKVIGAIVCLHSQRKVFSEKEVALLESFAAQAVIAIENARLLNELRQRTDDLTELLEQQTATSEVLQVISSSPGDLEPVFATMLENAVRICDAKFGNIYRWDGELLHIVAAHNTPPALVEARRRAAVRPTGVIGRMVATKTVLHITDLAAHEAYTEERDPGAISAVELGGVHTFVTVPMVKENEMIGSFSLFRQEVRPFTDKQIALVTSFAAQAVIAIENTRLLSELRQSTDELGRSVGELRALGEVSRAVNSTLDLETVLSTIVAKAVQLSNTDAGAIYVFDDMHREFHLRATYAMDRALIDALSKQHIGIDETNVTLALAQREPTQIGDLSKETPNEINEITLRAGYRARLTAPLFRGGEVVGLLVVRRRTPGAFPQNTVDLVKTFAAQSVLAIQNARLFDNVETRTRELAKSLRDLQTAQDRLVQTEKLASLGQLTAGIAHEIKNPLNFVNNFSALSAELIDELQETLGAITVDDKTRAEITELSDMLRDNLGKVVQHGKRADSIVKNMLLHSRQGSGERQPVDVNALVEESLNLAYHGARAERKGFNITLERSFDPAVGNVDLFPQEVTRVLLNLISNGFYAAIKRKAEANGGYVPRCPPRPGISR